MARQYGTDVYGGGLYGEPKVRENGYVFVTRSVERQSHVVRRYEVVVQVVRKVEVIRQVARD